MDHGALLLVELGAVVLGLGILARLASRLAISPIPLYLLAGLAIGEGGLVPVVTSEEFIEVGAELGVIFLLLMLGLEYSAGELVAGVRAVAPAGPVDLALNFTPGFLMGLILGWGDRACALSGWGHLHLIDGSHRQAVERPRLDGQPGDPGGAIHPGLRRPGYGDTPPHSGRPDPGRDYGWGTPHDRHRHWGDGRGHCLRPSTGRPAW